MSVPWHDWQFWAVTLIALLALWWLARGLLPGAGKRRGRTKATLTVRGKRVER